MSDSLLGLRTMTSISGQFNVIGSKKNWRQQHGDTGPAHSVIVSV
jgi:hypothetical protein